MRYGVTWQEEAMPSTIAPTPPIGIAPPPIASACPQIDETYPALLSPKTRDRSLWAVAGSKIRPKARPDVEVVWWWRRCRWWWRQHWHSPVAIHWPPMIRRMYADVRSWVERVARRSAWPVAGGAGGELWRRA